MKEMTQKPLDKRVLEPYLLTSNLKLRDAKIIRERGFSEKITEPHSHNRRLRLPRLSDLSLS